MTQEYQYYESRETFSAKEKEQIMRGLGSHERALTMAFTGSATWGKLPNLSEPRFFLDKMEILHRTVGRL